MNIEDEMEEVLLTATLKSSATGAYESILPHLEYLPHTRRFVDGLFKAFFELPIVNPKDDETLWPMLLSDALIAISKSFAEHAEYVQQLNAEAYFRALAEQGLDFDG